MDSTFAMTLTGSLEIFSKVGLLRKRQQDHRALKALEGTFPAVISAFEQSRTREPTKPVAMTRSPH